MKEVISFDPTHAMAVENHRAPLCHPEQPTRPRQARKEMNRAETPGAPSFAFSAKGGSHGTFPQFCTSENCKLRVAVPTLRKKREG